MEFKMKIKLYKLAFLPFLFAPQLAVAGSFSDYAQIVSVEKVYENYIVKEPYQECYIREVRETVAGSGDGSATNEIIGGIFGGLVGNAIGKGDGKKAATLAGIALGASLAHDEELAKSGTDRIVSQEVCETKYQQKSERRLSHYLVNYEYDGRSFSYKTKRRPLDDTIKVKVRISPIKQE